MTGIGKSPHASNRRDTSTHSCLEFSGGDFKLGGGECSVECFSNFETNNLAKCMYDLLNWFIFLVNEHGIGKSLMLQKYIFHRVPKTNLKWESQKGLAKLVY